jgi:hypothetical protein
MGCPYEESVLRDSTHNSRCCSNLQLWCYCDFIHTWPQLQCSAVRSQPQWPANDGGERSACTRQYAPITTGLIRRAKAIAAAVGRRAYDRASHHSAPNQVRAANVACLRSQRGRGCCHVSTAEDRKRAGRIRGRASRPRWPVEPGVQSCIAKLAVFWRQRSPTSISI